MKTFLISLTLFSSKLFSQSILLVNGAFNCYNNLVYINSNQPIVQKTANAYFTYTAIPVINPENFCHAGNVKLNEMPLKQNRDSLFYYDDSNNVDFTRMNWKVSGHKDIPNMAFNYSGVFPSFSSFISLPDTLRKSDTLLINVPETTDTDSIILNIWDKLDLEGNRKYMAFKFSKETDAIYILPKWISGLSIGNRAYISIEIVNYNYQTISGMNFLFRNYSGIIKPSIVITN